MFSKPPIDGGSTSAKTLNRIRSGQFIYSRLFAFEGAYTYVPDELDGVYMSNEFPTFDVDSAYLDPRWLAEALRSAEHWSDLAVSSKGLGLRRQRVQTEAVLAYEVWLPPVAYQREVVARLAQIDTIRVRRAAAGGRLGAALPSVLNQAFAGLT
jgi:type I restriction enzyme S subunit